jgi:carbamoyltransferase
MRVLGVSTAHDSSVCIVEDGKIVSYWKEERLSRVKKDSNPIRATQEALKNIDTIDVVAYCDPSVSDFVHTYVKSLKKYVNVYDVIDFSNDHHLQHASLAFYNSGFKEAAVVVIDRNGSGFFDTARESETIFHATYPHAFNPIYKSFWLYNNEAHIHAKEYKKKYPHLEVDVKSMYGIVKVYETATSLIEQHILENGKTMGLSSYGDKTAQFPDLFVNKTNIPNDYYFGHELNDGENLEAVYLELTDLKNKSFTKHNLSIYADYAWQVQKQTQDAACYLIKKAIERTGCKNIIVTGGYGLNVVANGYYIDQFPDVNFYFEPLADDSGNSIGGAMLAYRMMTKDSNIYPIQTTSFHGRKYDLSHVAGDEITVKGIVEKLLDGNSIAVYQGLAEAGPRALGNRSILFDARDPNAGAIVNRIKKREWYRPFAAMILKEDINLYFNNIDLSNSKFMTVSFEANEKAKKEIPGVIHVDSSCRVQVVDETDGIIFKLLQEFKKQTGVGALLNTSFNLAGEPLVETPEDALKTLNNSALNFVWFADKGVIVSK